MAMTNGEVADQPKGVSVIGRLGMLGLGILPSIAIGAISIVLPAISDAFHNGSNTIQIKMVSTMLGLGMMIGAPIGGIVADRLGHRRVLIVSTLAFAALGLSISVATALWQIIAARFLLGIATGTMGVGLAAIVSDRFAEKDQSRWIGFTGAAATLAMLGLFPLTGMLADIGWRYAFTIYSLAVLVAAAIAFGIPRLGSTSSAEVPEAPRRFDVRQIPWKGIVLAGILGTLATGTSLYWPFRLRELGVTSARELAMYGLPQMLALGFCALSYGWIRRRISIMSVFLLGSTASCISLILMGLAPNPVLLGLGLMVEGCAVGILTPNLTIYAITLSGVSERGRNIGLVKGALYGSPFLTQFALEPISQANGPGMALCAIAVMAGVTALMIGPIALSEQRRALPL